MYTIDTLYENIFGIVTMCDNYEERKVENTQNDKFILDTARVTDRNWIYETAVKHKDFNYNDWIVLESYDDVESAKEGHSKWLRFLDSDNYETLHDIYEKVDHVRADVTKIHSS